MFPKYGYTDMVTLEDDELNPTTLGTIERLLPPVKTGRMVVMPAGPDTEGHRPPVKAIAWREHHRAFMDGLKK
jgi:homoserine O-acetyltransferase